MEKFVFDGHLNLKLETASLLLGFNLNNTKKKGIFYKRWDININVIKQKTSRYYSDLLKEYKKVIQYWRNNDSILIDLYWYLRWNYPFPIPYVLFFSVKNENIKWIGDLADKWLIDIFSRESFYKRNKEIFTKSEVKYFLTCDWYKSIGSYEDIIDYFFETKIKANNLSLPIGIFHMFYDCFTHKVFKVVIEYFKFLCNNKKYINISEIKLINNFLKSEYILTGKDINFKNHTYHSLRQLSDVWNIIKERFRGLNNQEFTQNYINFICNNINKISDIKENIIEICDFLYFEFNNNGQNFDFDNLTWEDLKHLSDEWHLENRMARNPYLKKYLFEKWEKSSINDFIRKENKKTWTIKEITSGLSLYKEGEDMHHCVFTYIENCIRKNCFIFSVSCTYENNDKEKRIATIEISKNMEIIQAKGKYNSPIDKKTANIVNIWVKENHIVWNNKYKDILAA